MDADGSGVASVTRYTATKVFLSGFPAWSADGSRIVFVANTALDGSDTQNANRTNNLWVVNADGTGVIPLTRLTSGVDAEDPRWRP
jgi:Tol biopolymer transport system component